MQKKKQSLGKLKLPPGTVADRERQSQNQLILSFYPTMPQRSETLTFPHRWETGRGKPKNKKPEVLLCGTLPHLKAEHSCTLQLMLPRCTAAAAATARQKQSDQKKTNSTKTNKQTNKRKRRPALIWQWWQLGKSTMMLQLFSWVRKQEVGHRGMSSKTTLPLIGWGRQTGCQTD